MRILILFALVELQAVSGEYNARIVPTRNYTPYSLNADERDGRAAAKGNNQSASASSNRHGNAGLGGRSAVNSMTQYGATSVNEEAGSDVSHDRSDTSLLDMNAPYQRQTGSQSRYPQSQSRQTGLGSQASPTLRNGYDSDGGYNGQLGGYNEISNSGYRGEYENSARGATNTYGGSQGLGLTNDRRGQGMYDNNLQGREGYGRNELDREVGGYPREGLRQSLQRDGLQRGGLQQEGLQRGGLQREGLQREGQLREGLQTGGGLQREGLLREGLQRGGYGMGQGSVNGRGGEHGSGGYGRESSQERQFLGFFDFLDGDDIKDMIKDGEEFGEGRGKGHGRGREGRGEYEGRGEHDKRGERDGWDKKREGRDHEREGHGYGYENWGNGDEGWWKSTKDWIGNTFTGGGGNGYGLQPNGLGGPNLHQGMNGYNGDMREAQDGSKRFDRYGNRFAAGSDQNHGDQERHVVGDDVFRGTYDDYRGYK